MYDIYPHLLANQPVETSEKVPTHIYPPAVLCSLKKEFCLKEFCLKTNQLMQDYFAEKMNPLQ